MLITWNSPSATEDQVAFNNVIFNTGCDLNDTKNKKKKRNLASWWSTENILADWKFPNFGELPLEKGAV